MGLKVEDIEDPKNYYLINSIPYDELLPFVIEYIRKKSHLMYFFWSFCIASLISALWIRYSTGGYFNSGNIIAHSALGLILFPILCIPVHEFLHITPYYLSGARKIRIGMNLKQYMFYVTAHRYVATPLQFKIVAVFPFILINSVTLLLILLLPGLWKWSLSLFLFVHSTMCAGDFALLNFYHMNRGKEIYTWDDADRKIAYFYAKI